MSLLAELKRRNVIRMAGLYLVGAWLDQAYAAHDGGLVRLPWDPAMDPLRDDPRFAALIKKMGFPK